MTILASYMAKKQKQSLDIKDAFLSISKGKSVDNNSRVYDLWIFENGRAIYNGIENVEEEGLHNLSVSLEDLYKIKKYISNYSTNEIGQAKGRDNPLTILKFHGKKIVFQTERISGNLLELNNLLESLVDNI